MHDGVQQDYTTEDEYYADEVLCREHRSIIRFEGFELEAVETVSSLGILISLEGHLGLASAVLLDRARNFGEITIVFMDDTPPLEKYGERSQKISAEWNSEAAVEQGVPEMRKESEIETMNREVVEVSQLEEWARLWLSLD